MTLTRIATRDLKATIADLQWLALDVKEAFEITYSNLKTTKSRAY